MCLLLIVGKINGLIFILIFNFQIFPQEKIEVIERLMEANKYLNEAMLLIEKNEYLKAEEILRKSLEMIMGFDSYEAKKLKFKLNINLGDALYRSGRGEEGIIPYMDALAVSKDLKNKEYEAFARVYLARSYLIAGQYDLCLEEAHRGLKISKENNYYEISSLSLFFCGMANRNLKQYKNALDFFEEALTYGQKAGKRPLIIGALNEKGNVLFLTGKYNEALKLKFEALDFAKRYGDRQSISNCLNDISFIYSQRGNHLQAENYLIESLKIAEELGNQRNIFYNLLNLAEEQIKLGKKQKSKLNLIRALEVSEKFGSQEQKKIAKKYFSEYLAQEGDFEKAYSALLDAYENQDKLFTEELKRNIINIAYSYEIEKKEKEIELIRREKEIEKKQKKYLTLAFILATGLIMLLGIVLRLKIKTNKILQEAKKKEEELARMDPLTSLANRRCAYEKIMTEINRYERTGIPFSVVLMDIDQFKQINDKFGHKGGDMVLEKLANILKSFIRSLDTAIRWGGEEFMVLLPDTELEGALKVAEKLRDIISGNEIDYKGKIIKITATFGVAQFAGDLENCLKKADEALYEGKSMGKNRVQMEKN